MITIDQGIFTNPYVLLTVVGGLALVPFLLLSCTSFLKISIVLNVLRSALGAQNFPSGSTITLLSLVLSFQVMLPVTREIAEHLQSSSIFKQASESLGNGKAKVSLLELQKEFLEAVQPLKRFMSQNSGARERKFFVASREAREFHYDEEKLASRMSEIEGGECQKREESGGVKESCGVPGEDFSTLLSSFVVSQLREGFAMGFMLYLPFVVVDLVVAHVLMGLGMMMVSPVTISLPLKLILFVVTDGWLMAARGLMLSYS